MNNDFAAQLQEELLLLHLIETQFLDDLEAYEMWLDLYRPIEED
jgi:hypothetical protein